MIEFNSFELANGLRVYVHEDHTTPMAVVNITYNVGSRDENEQRTGFAHLFEHLMFSGSKHISDYDTPVQLVGGENNAFTSADITNYYITLPAENLETALWLESDRMLSLDFNPQALEVQRKVVIEEYKQRYLNQPYGDIWLKVLPLSYEVHPYKWAPIGKDISHIEGATMEDVIAFYNRFYNPNNAVLVVAGDVVFDQVKALVERWFGDIPAGPVYNRTLNKEPVRTVAVSMTTTAAVPLEAIIKTWHMPGRYEEGFFEADLLCDILGRSKSSRLYNQLLKQQGLFNSIGASITSSLDTGLLIVRGFLNPGITIEQAEAAITKVLEEFVASGPTEEELQKVKNQSEATLAFSEVDLLNRAMNLGYAAVAGNPEWANQDLERMRAVTLEGVKLQAKQLLDPSKMATLYYRAQPSDEVII